MIKKFFRAISVFFIIIGFLIITSFVWIGKGFYRYRLLFSIWKNRKQFENIEDLKNGKYTTTILMKNRISFKPLDLIVSRNGGVSYMKVFYRPILQNPEMFEGFASLYWKDGSEYTTIGFLKIKNGEISKPFKFKACFDHSSISEKRSISECEVNLNEFIFNLK